MYDYGGGGGWGDPLDRDPAAVLDDLYDKQSGELDRKKRIGLLREFEKRALEQSYTIPTIWWHRIIVTNSKLKGWHITPSHYVGQDLADVWLD